MPARSRLTRVVMALATIASPLPLGAIATAHPPTRQVSSVGARSAQRKLPVVSGPAPTALRVRHDAAVQAVKLSHHGKHVPGRNRLRAITVPIARAAADPAATISDFQFSPSTITVHVGDTVTWFNAGPSQHTASAANGSFDTGTINKGASASQTFSQPGTFAYFCKIHPFMHGTVVVLSATSSATATQSQGAAGSGGGSGGAGPAAAGSGAGVAPGSAQTLPMTGLDVGVAALSGVLILSLGLVLRRRGRYCR